MTESIKQTTAPAKKLVHRIMVETPVCEEDAQELAVQIGAMHPTLQGPFQTWMKTGSLDGAPTVQGYSIERLLDERVTVGVPCAFLWLDALIKRPEKAFKYMHEPTVRIELSNRTKQRKH